MSILNAHSNHLMNSVNNFISLLTPEAQQQLEQQFHPSHEGVNIPMAISNIDKLKEQRRLIDSRIQAAEARQKNSERKKDTRRKILLGSYYLEEAKKKNQWEEVKELMNGYLTRNSDRTLFDLPEILESDKHT